jgi:DNA helicase HerA-like ATPase
MVDIGKISGRVTTKEFSFDAEARVNKLDYVAAKDHEGKWVLAIIDSVVNFENITKATARVIGYRDGRGFLKTPKMPFAPTTPVYTAENNFIQETIGLDEDGAYIGLLDGYDIQVNLPIKHMITKHICILAKTGTGKSYVTGVLLEELAEKEVPVVVIDPHGEYHSLIKANNKKDELRFMERFGVKPKDYRNRVQILNLQGSRGLKLNSKLSAEEVFQMLPTKLSSSQKGVLYSALKNLEGRDYTLRDIIDEVNANKSPSKWNLMSMLEFLENTKIFSAAPTLPKDMVVDGKVTIVDLKDARPEIQQIVVLKLAEELFNARKYGKIPSFLFVVEEAHNFCPERGFGEVASSKILRTIASEGRKFGMGLCIISQRPARVDKSVLSQCNTQIILKVTNPNDLKAITESVEGVTPGIREEIRDLPVGVAMVVGVVDQPLMVDIRIRRSLHGGEAVKISAEPEPSPTENLLALRPKIAREAVLKEYKDARDVKLVHYPVWLVKAKYKEKDTNLFIDGITGEMFFEDGGGITRSSGVRVLLEMPPSNRLLIFYLTAHKLSTMERMAEDLKMPLTSVKGKIDELMKQNFVGTDGYMFKSTLRMENIPADPSKYQIKETAVREEKAGQTIDFMLTSDFARKTTELWSSMAIDSIESAYYPYWLVRQGDRKFLVDGLSGKADLIATSAVEKLLT